MLEIILGAVIAIVVAYFFYRCSTQDLEKEVSNLRNELIHLKETTKEIQLNRWENLKCRDAEHQSIFH
jgi:hypothetical protein